MFGKRFAAHLDDALRPNQLVNFDLHCRSRLSLAETFADMAQWVVGGATCQPRPLDGSIKRAKAVLSAVQNMLVQVGKNMWLELNALRVGPTMQFRDG